MKCPKCDASQPDQNETCSACGIVFRKYYKYHPPEGAEPEEIAETLVIEEIPTLRDFLLDRERPFDSLAFGGRLLLFGLILVWSWPLITSSIDSNYVGESFLHLVNLPFHEAGHVLFRPFGAFLTSLGGTLGQLAIPLTAGFVLLTKTRDPFGASVAFWWFGENLLDIAPYINDARAGQLPLLGGNFGHSSPYGFHDWEYLLGETGLLSMDHTLASLSFFIGSLIMLGTLAWGGFLLLLAWKHRHNRS